MAMGLTKQDLKAVEMMLRELPKPEYEDLCDFIGLDAPELRILDLKYRHYTERSVPMAADTSVSLTKRVTRKRKAPLSSPENTKNPSK